MHDVDLSKARPGDIALIRAKVLRVSPVADIGVLVELFSKTDQYEAWVRPDLVVEVRPKPLPKEPAVGTLAVAYRRPGFATDPSGAWTQVWVRLRDGWEPVANPGEHSMTWEELHGLSDAAPVKVLVPVDPEEAADYA